MNQNITNFHRLLSTYIRGNLTAGCFLMDLIEPTVTDKNPAQHSAFEDERRVPI